MRAFRHPMQDGAHLHITAEINERLIVQTVGVVAAFGLQTPPDGIPGVMSDNRHENPQYRRQGVMKRHAIRQHAIRCYRDAIAAGAIWASADIMTPHERNPFVLTNQK